MTHGTRITSEENAVAAGQDLRPAMRNFAPVARLGDRLWRPSRRWRYIDYIARNSDEPSPGL